MAAFLDLFHPLAGDVLYGLTAQREAYLRKYVLKVLQEDYEDLNKDFSQVTENEIEERMNKYGLTGTTYINRYNEPIVEPNYNDLNNIAPLKFNMMEMFQKAYHLKLKDTKYSPANVKDAQDTSLLKGNANYAGKANATQQETAKAAHVLAIRRSCKYGIEYITTKSGGINVHYILDGITMSQVVNKQTLQLWTATVGVPITTSELRYIFRNWGRFKNRNTLHFYENDNTTQAPWLRQPDLWAAYANARVQKYRNHLNTKNGALVTSFEQAYNNRQFAKAIEHFADMSFPD
jgi:hypothetical protein